MSKKLTDVCSITTGKLDSNAAVINGNYPFFTCAPEPSRIDNFAFDNDVILLAGNNAQGNFHINRYCGKFNAYQRTYIITEKDGYDLDYIYYSLSIDLAQLKKVSQGSQTKFITMQILDSFGINDIPFNEQQKRVAVLKAINSKIQLNNKINAELECFAKTIYDYWFVQFDFPNTEGKPYKSSGGKMEWNEELKCEIPEGWEVKLLPECCNIIDCLHSKKPDFCKEDETSYLLQLDNLIDMGLLDLSNKYYVSNEMYGLWTSRIEVKNGDMVITNAGRVGSIARIPKNIVAGIGRNMTAIRPLTITPFFLYYFFNSDDIAGQIKVNTDSGAFFGSLNVQGIKKLLVTIPKSSEQLECFEKIASPIREHIEENAQENQQLTQLRDFLLPLLMNGQVTVK